MTRNVRDIASGAIFILMGGLYGSITLFQLPLWRAPNMGPGYFPMILSAALVIMGGVVAFKGFFTPQSEPFGAIPWRAVAMISLAIVVFALTLWPLGAFLASVATAAIASFSTPEMKPRKALLVGLGIGVFCTLIFYFGIKLPVPLFGTLFG